MVTGEQLLATGEQLLATGGIRLGNFPAATTRQ
jgi:hypothetical protein